MIPKKYKALKMEKDQMDMLGLRVVKDNSDELFQVEGYEHGVIIYSYPNEPVVLSTERVDMLLTKLNKIKRRRVFNTRL